jgi:hypothetical protein
MEIIWPPYNEEPEQFLPVLLSSLFMAMLALFVLHFSKVKRLFKKNTNDDR